MSQIVPVAHPISEAQWNNSPSKMQFTFAKGNRFTKLRPPICKAEYYDAPSTKSKRSCTFGKGVRFNTRNTNDIPPPGTYFTCAAIACQNKKTRCSFGVSWKAFEKVFVKEKPAADLSIPGPGAYDVIPANFAYNANKITIKKRLKSSLSVDMSIPGPGTYDIPNTISAYGMHVNSKFLNSQATKFNPKPTIKKNASMQELSPGPAKYNPKSSMSSDGKYCLSTFKSSLTRTLVI